LEGFVLRKQFGIQLKKIRQSKKITQKELAQLISVSVGYVSNLERGINSPSFELLEVISRKLEVPIKELFDFD
jgi:transcriptional regulator with XRE-family HTH domain